ncbi:MAG: hypothetical protein GOV15_02735, partial [Candidatus Diapherotrites archaeon]|nr:hypothetical protein [Candidatus Diapherotrites archaeon]
MRKLLLIALLFTLIPFINAATPPTLCDALTQCPQGQHCATIPGNQTPQCYEDPCEAANCTGMFQECVIMESYPEQVRCMGTGVASEIPWIPIIIAILLIVTLGGAYYAIKNKDKHSKKDDKKTYKNIKNLGIIFTIVGIMNLIVDGEMSV